MKKELSDKQRAYLYSDKNRNKLIKNGYVKGQISPFKNKKWEDYGGYRFPAKGHINSKLSQRNRLNIGEKNPMWGIRLEKNVERMKKNNPVFNQEIAKRIRKNYSLTMKKKYSNPEEKKIFIRRISKGWRKITKPEKIVIDIIQKYSLPFKYVGDRHFWIDNVNPDFVNSNGEKIVIEVFGDYWHDPLKNKHCSYNRTEEGRKEFLKSYGWKCLVLWENEIKSLKEEEIVNKIKEFENFSSKASR